MHQDWDTNLGVIYIVILENDLNTKLSSRCSPWKSSILSAQGGSGRIYTEGEPGKSLSLSFSLCDSHTHENTHTNTHTNKNKHTEIKERDMDLTEMNDYNDPEKCKVRPSKCYLDVSKRRQIIL